MHADGETQRHQTDWKHFVALIKYSVVATVIMLILMAAFLTEHTPS
jgi:hypothetical protein